MTSLAGQLLIAMPQMQDHRFARSVIFLCSHSKDGAMGLVVNKLVDSLTLSKLMEQLGIAADGLKADTGVHFGGPVEPGRGFVLHSADYSENETMPVDGKVALTATLDILRAIGRGEGPARCFLALGYAGWGPGQLELEMAQRSWFTEPEDPRLIFDDDRDKVWKEALDRRSRAL